MPSAAVDRFLTHFDRKTAAGGQWMVRCPAHADDRASLAVREGREGRVLLTCHAGCTKDDIVAALHLTDGDLFDGPSRGDGYRREVASYNYCDETGKLLYRSVRFEPKDFRQCRPDGAGGWIWKTAGIPRVIYRLPELKGRDAVLVVEGEKDADTCWQLDLPATTNVGGASQKPEERPKWRDEYAQQLVAAGVKRVVVIPDNDPPGYAHANHVARSCHVAGLSVRLVALPDVPEKGDVSDYLATHSKQDLLTLIAAALAWTPTVIAVPGVPEMRQPFDLSKVIKDERNDTLYRLARALKVRRLPDSEIAWTIMCVNAKCCEPPLPETEIRTIVQNAIARPMRSFIPHTIEVS